MTVQFTRQITQISQVAKSQYLDHIGFRSLRHHTIQPINGDVVGDQSRGIQKHVYLDHFLTDLHQIWFVDRYWSHKGYFIYLHILKHTLHD